MASKRRIRRKSCTGKVRHQTAQEAAQAIFWINKTHGYRGMMNAYKCRFCHAYHVGHSPR